MQNKQFLEKQNSQSNIANVIGVISGKGGVGKSLVTSLLASEFNKQGFKTAILDADITGPSIPKAFGVSGPLMAYENGTYPAKSAGGIKICSTNLIIDDETDPVVWRGPILSGAIKQFWSDIVWGDVDYMFVDMPPGTSDAALTVFQSIPLKGIVIVTSPQDLVSMIVMKAVKMAGKMGVPIIGLAENMSYFEAPDTHKVYEIFGESKIDDLADEHGLDVLARIPIDPAFNRLIDQGRVEEIDASSFLGDAVDMIIDFEEEV